MDIKIKYRGSYKLVDTSALSAKYIFSNGKPQLLKSMADLDFFKIQPNSYDIIYNGSIKPINNNSFSSKSLPQNKVKNVNIVREIQKNVIPPVKTVMSNKAQTEVKRSIPVVPTNTVANIVKPRVGTQVNTITEQPVIKQRAKELTKNIKKKASNK